MNRESERDAAGNLSVDRAGYKYYYDYESRLIEIKNASNVSVAEYYYSLPGPKKKEGE